MNSKAPAPSQSMMSELRVTRQRVLLAIFSVIFVLEAFWFASYAKGYDWAVGIAETFHAPKDALFDIDCLLGVCLEGSLIVALILTHRKMLDVQKIVTMVLFLLSALFLVFRVATVIGLSCSDEEFVSDDASYILSFYSRRRVDILEANVFHAIRYAVNTIYFVVRFALLGWYFDVLPPAPTSFVRVARGSQVLVQVQV